MQLTSRERLTRLLKREPLDRVPVSTYELNPLDTDSWYYQQPSYVPLFEYLKEHTDVLYMWDGGMKNKHTWDESEESWAEDKSTFTRRTLHTPKGDISTLTRVDVDVNTVWTVEPFFKTSDDMDRYLSLPWEYAGTDMAGFHKAEERLGDRGIVLCDTADPVCMVAGWFDFEPFLMLAIEERDRMKYFMDALLERLLLVIRDKLEQGAGPIWRIYGPEYCGPEYFAPDGFRELVMDYDKPIIDLIHEYGGYARVHAHGRVTQRLDQFVEMGADATDPLEPPPQGDVDLAEVKKKYGDRLLLFGNIELSFLEYWEGAEIERYVRESIEAAKDGGGYVIMPTAAPINTPIWDRTADNYRRFIDTALECGQY